jgi:hypothetical protein
LAPFYLLDISLHYHASTKFFVSICGYARCSWSHHS